MAEAARSSGADAFAARDFATALRFFSQALELDPKGATAWSNRAVCNYELGKYEDAITDGKRTLALAPSLHKVYLCMGRAALALKDPLRAEEFYRDALGLAPNNPIYRQLLGQATEAHAKHYFASFTANMPIEIKWFGEQRGKGFVARKDIGPGNSLCRETPIASVRNVNCQSSLSSCSQCLRTMVTSDDLIPYPELFSMLSLSAPKWISCPRCSERYCSEACREMAFKTHHSLLCHGNDKQHPSARLEALARSLTRTNPLLIARMYATALRRLVDGQVRSWAHAFEPFAMFVSNPEPSPSDEQLVALIVEVLQKAVPHLPISSYVTLSSYRRLNGAIIRNASSVHTISDVHSALIGAHDKGAPRADVYKMLGLAAETPLAAVLDTDFLLSLCIEATALYAIANSFNHSCDPNFVLVSSSNSHAMQLLTMKPVKQGQELLISYIDESMPVAQRREKLREMYQFACDCVRCKTGS